MVAHRATKSHGAALEKKKTSNEYRNRRDGLTIDSLHRPCSYVCDKGVHKGKYLYDVVQFHPEYIDFLISNHRETFPDRFTHALLACGISPARLNV